MAAPEARIERGGQDHHRDQARDRLLRSERSPRSLGVQLPPISVMPVEYLTPAIEDRAHEVQLVLARKSPRSRTSSSRGDERVLGSYFCAAGTNSSDSTIESACRCPRRSTSPTMGYSSEHADLQRCGKQFRQESRGHDLR